MNTRSIRFRLTVWYAVILTAGLGLFSILIWITLQHQLIADLDAELEGRANRLEAYFKEEYAHATGRHLLTELKEFSQAYAPTSYVEIKGASGFAFHYPPQATPDESRIVKRHFSWNGEEFAIEVRAPMADTDRTLALLRELLLALIPLVIALACIGGTMLSARALQPLTALTDAAQSISIENLSARVPVADTGDELARLAATLNTMLTRLEAAVTTLSQFVADASHEFRTPLAVIQTTVELALRRPRPAAEYRAALEDVAGDVQRMTHLVEDLLALARNDTGAVDMPRGPIDVRSLLGEVLAGTVALAESRQIRLIPPESEGPVWITGNRAALHRLFLVLIDNALKYSHAGGEVRALIERQDTAVSVTIRDFGVGIPAAQLPHIFERFYRGDRARATGGHGLGLALAQSIVQAHWATIEASSIEGISTDFRVEFVAREAPVETRSKVPAPAV